MLKIIEGKNIFEVKLSRLLTHITGSQIGIVTAFRNIYSTSENRKRNEELKKDIRKHGFGYTAVEGHYVEISSESKTDTYEESFIIFDNSSKQLKSFLIKIGEKYNQDSVLFVTGGEGYLIGTIDENELGEKVDFPGYKNEVKVGSWHPNLIGTFYSKMKGRTFVFDNIKYEPNNLTKGYKGKNNG